MQIQQYDNDNNKLVTEDKSYTIYHYNGLEKKDKSSPLSSCNIIITSVDAIGKSVENDTNINSGGGGIAIDEVIKTRFPKCKIQWSGPSPSID
jgi:hypothetical protein